MTHPTGTGRIPLSLCAPGDRLLGLGCDTEQAARLDAAIERRPGFYARWFSERERRWIERTAAPQLERARIFCLKEAAVKAVNPLARIGIAGVEVFPEEDFLPRTWLNPAQAGSGLGSDGLGGVHGEEASAGQSRVVLRSWSRLLGDGAEACVVIVSGGEREILFDG